MDNTTPRWTDLPGQLLPLIAKHFDNRTQILSLRAVCSLFLSSVPPPPKPTSPYKGLKIPIPGGPFPFSTPNPNLNSIKKLLLTQSTIFAIQPLNKISNPHETSKTWFIKVQESSSGKVHVQDPFYGIIYSYGNLAKKLPKSLNLLDYRVKEVTKVYGLKRATIIEDKCKELDAFQYPSLRKVVVSSGLDEVEDEFTVMALHNRGVLGVWRKGDLDWTKIDVGPEISFEDVIFHRRKFYALSSKGVTMTIDSVSLNVTEVSAPVGHSDYKYLAKSSKDLYLIVKYLLDDPFEFGNEDDSLHSGNNNRLHLNVFKLDLEHRQWLKVVKGLDEDGVIFLSSECSFAISAKEFPGLKGNCVYFTDDSFPLKRDIHPGWECGIFDLEDETFCALSDLSGYSKIFWPPPTWLKHNRD